MKMKYNSTIDKCLSFIRFSMDPVSFKAPEMDDRDWASLYSFSFKQAILGVTMEGVRQLKKHDIEPPWEVLARWLYRMVQIEKDNKAINMASAKLLQQLEKEGFRCCLLKGQGNNLLYPNAYSRTPGDIDVWMVGAKGTKHPVRSIIKYVRSIRPKERAVYHHIDFGKFDNIETEIHYRPSFMNNFVHNHRLQKWFLEQADAQFENRVELPDNAGTVAVPTPEFNAVFQLVHLYTHVLNKGVGLRHIIDYYYVLLAVKDKQDMEKTLRHLGLEKIAEAVMWVMKSMLGMDGKYMIAKPNERLGRMLAEEILIRGNFGRYSSANKKRKPGQKIPKWESKLRMNIMRLRFDLRLMLYFPSECLCEPVFRFYHFLWRRWANLCYSLTNRI